MFRKLVDKILGEDSGNNTITGWIAGFTVIVLLRSFLEIFSVESHSSSTTSSPQIADNAQRLHYFLFFVTTALLISLTVTIFTRQKSQRVINLALYGLPVIFLAPIIDLVLNAGGRVHMGYLSGTHTKLLLDFFTFFGANNGATTGMRIEIFVILCFVGWYVWMKKKGALATFGAVLVCYILIFLMGSMPGILYTISHFSLSGVPEGTAINSIETSINESNIATNMVYGSLRNEYSFQVFSMRIGALLSQLFFTISFFAGLLLFWYTARGTTKIILSNSRPERISFYISLIALGAFYAYSISSVVLTWVDWVGFIVIILSWSSSCMFAIHTNDVADIEIDVISNPSRPLPQKTLSVETMRDVGFMWLVLSLVGSYIVGYYVFFMNIIFTSAYYLYSAQPLRLKQAPIFSSFLISVACLATILAGFFFVSPNKMIEAFPLMFALGIVVVFTLGVNIRDIKDIAGDRALGILTLPVIFGRHGRNVVGVLLALSFLLAPIFFSPYVTFFTAVPSAVVGYWLCIKQNYNEKYIFLLFFIFLIASIMFYSSVV